MYSNPAQVERGATRQFTAYVSVSPSTIVWSVNDIQGGNSTYGTITQAGLYTAPSVIPAQNVVVVKATSTAYATKFGASNVTITVPQPWVWSTYPSTVPAGAFSISINGAGFQQNTYIALAGTPLTTTYISPTSLKAVGTLAANQAGTKLAITAVTPGVGGLTSQPVLLSVGAAPSPTTVSVAPATANVNLSSTQQFTPTVTGPQDKSVTWSVNGVAGGSATVGTISASGLYTAPAALPSPATVTVQATSNAAPTVFASATVTLISAPPTTVTVSPTPVNVTLGNTQQFASTVTGPANTAVTWSVNGVAGGTPLVGTISSAGLYKAPATMPVSATVTVTATSVASPGASSNAAVTLVNPPPLPPVNLTHARFLEQATFGPTATDLAHIGQVGISAWLDEQFSMAETPVGVPTDNNQVKAEYLWRLAHAPDQLRQKMAYALGQIIVISYNKNIYAPEIYPYLDILSKNAFGNYRQLLGAITVSPQMGKYLDLANSNKPGIGGGANENYARELIQLFSLGLYQLNPDGSQKLDASNQPIPTYTQTDIQQVALALTGWTYPTAPGSTPQANNWENFTGPMETRQSNHDVTPKSFLGCSAGANRTVQQDTDSVLDCVFNHPNAGPFLATRLIRLFTVSNPSPAYIARITAVFENNGQGVRGDLKAMLRAILTDAEAATPVIPGKLKDPLTFYTGLVRALNGQISKTNTYSWAFVNMSQSPLTPNSVFAFYSPLYRIPRSNPPLFGPEFQIYSATDTVSRGDFIWQILTGQYGSEIQVDFTPFVAVAGNTTQLINLVDNTLLYGRMPAAMRTSLANVIATGNSNLERAQLAIYFTSLSGQYAVQF